MHQELYAIHHGLYREDIPFWLGLADQAGDPILELGCGAGRVLLALRGGGHHVYGLDCDLSMLHLLRNSAPDQQAIPVMAADMCQFQLAKQFALVILPCNTFSTLDESQRMSCLACASRHLEPGGIFAFSVPNPELLLSLPDRSEAELEDEFIHPTSGNPVQVSSAWQREADSLSVTWIYDHLLPDGTIERQVASTCHHLVSLERYEKEITSAGLNVLDKFGDFNHSAYRARSPNLIFLTAKDHR